MEVNKGRFYRIKWFWNILKNGLFLFGLRNRLTRLGLDFDPFYWVLEGASDIEPPQIKDNNTSDYEIVYLGIDEIDTVRKKIVGTDQTPRILDFHSQIMCIALSHKGEIAAFTLIELDHFKYKRIVFHLKKNEAYLFNMYTFEDHRGKNLAPYLRYQSYLMLRNMGRDRIYSITQFFNKSAKRFKKKLNSRNLKLYISIILFKKYHYHYLLKNYNS
jgi:hypothetical protein